MIRTPDPLKEVKKKKKKKKLAIRWSAAPGPAISHIETPTFVFKEGFKEFEDEGPQLLPHETQEMKVTVRILDNQRSAERAGYRVDESRRQVLLSSACSDHVHFSTCQAGSQVHRKGGPKVSEVGTAQDEGEFISTKEHDFPDHDQDNFRRRHRIHHKKQRMDPAGFVHAASECRSTVQGGHSLGESGESLQRKRKKTTGKGFQWKRVADWCEYGRRQRPEEE